MPGKSKKLALLRLDASAVDDASYGATDKMNARLYDVIIVGGGASGLMCAIHAGRRGLRVLVLEKAVKVGVKILVSGGGRCNFTNRWADPAEHYLSQNPHFCLSAMRRYEPAQFIASVEASGIDYHEKKLGQLFCDNHASDIVTMLLRECANSRVEIRTRSEVTSVERAQDKSFFVHTENARYQGAKLVIASGGLSLPKVATDFAFRTAKAFGMALVPTTPALVPLTWNNRDRVTFASLSGIAMDCEIGCAKTTFRENVLLTHRGLSGPAVLQISSYWREGDSIALNLLPDLDAAEWLAEARHNTGRTQLTTLLKSRLPNRVVERISGVWFEDQPVGNLHGRALADLAHQLNAWIVTPGGSEGYRTAEVTLGGISTDELSSRTFECKRVPGLYAIGEAVDVTGWLGGYNFQWAWASGYCCAQFL